jgi:hypothetical protein
MKAHLIDSAEPLKEGISYLALCGECVPRVRFVFFWDGDELDFYPEIHTRGVCAKCRDVQSHERYVYGIVNGQEAKIAEAL